MGVISEERVLGMHWETEAGSPEHLYGQEEGISMQSSYGDSPFDCEQSETACYEYKDSQKKSKSLIVKKEPVSPGFQSNFLQLHQINFHHHSSADEEKTKIIHEDDKNLKTFFSEKLAQDKDTDLNQFKNEGHIKSQQNDGEIVAKYFSPKHNLYENQENLFKNEEENSKRQYISQDTKTCAFNETASNSCLFANNNKICLNICAGCGKNIQDRFYLQAVERRWHACCLRCCMCGRILESDNSCFAREGNIYCKLDYYRIFCKNPSIQHHSCLNNNVPGPSVPNRRCSGCMMPISSRELVMRARHLVFHVACFACATCRSPLTKGDQYGMKDSMVLCRLHYEASIGPSILETDHCHLHKQIMFLSRPDGADAPSPLPHHPQGVNVSGPDSPMLGMSNASIMHLGGPAGDRLAASESYYGEANTMGVLIGGPTAPRQKGRPRKRKPKDLEAMSTGLDLNTEYLDLSAFGSSGGSGSSRTKRMRTSFKHHQLRTMKSYFAINHNPDAKDLKQLSQKTGLPKRVLQVWFQNARAKWRRMMLKQEGGSVNEPGRCVTDKSGGTCSEAGDLELDGYPALSPGSSSYHHHHHLMGTHSPQSID